MASIEWPTLCSGVVLCVGGWVLYWAGLHLTGALAGACIGLALAWVGSGAVLQGGASAMWWIVPAGGAAGFVLGIFLIRGLHRLFFFVVGATLGMALGQTVFGWAEHRWAALSARPVLAQGLFVLVGAAAGGLAMVYGSKWVVAMTTAAIGSLMIVASIPDPLALLAALPLAVGSFFLQIGVLRRLGNGRRREPEPQDD